MNEFQRGARIPALQQLISDLEGRDEICADISSDANIFYILRRQMFCTRCY